VLALVLGGIVWSVREPDRVEKFWVMVGPIISSGVTAIGFLLRRVP
jgi:hypothetical protein